jgi:hypothetical protein
VAKKDILSKTVALTVIFGPLVLLFLGSVYNILSAREWAIGMLVWFAAILLFAIVRKLTARKTLASTVVPTMAIDDGARRRILRGIWINKISIGLLLVVLPFGIANGLAHRAWLPTLAGAGMNLLLMYVLAQQIRRRRMLLDSPQE